VTPRRRFPTLKDTTLGTSRHHRINPDTAEELLRGRPLDPRAGYDTLDRLLTAASAPTRFDELAREAGTLAAFRAADLRAPLMRRPAARSKRARAATVRAATVAVATAALGGVAFAATGTPPFSHHTNAGPAGPDPHLAAAATTRPPLRVGSSSATIAPQASARSASTTTTAVPTTPATGPSPSLVGLCRAYTAHATHNPGKALISPAFAALITAAGGGGNVPAFCATLLDTPIATTTTKAHAKAAPRSGT
jgi:hypothetical protein